MDRMDPANPSAQFRFRKRRNRYTRSRDSLFRPSGSFFVFFALRPLWFRSWLQNLKCKIQVQCSMAVRITAPRSTMPTISR